MVATATSTFKTNVKSIWCINFQGHRKSKIVLSDGITGLIGTNDVGKTALGIRALNLLRFNRPVGAGKRYIRDGEKTAIVGVEFQDNTKILLKMYRKRPNKYVIIKPDGTRLERKVIGKDVPEEVTAQFGNFGEINLQTQRESAYFILDAAGKIAQFINMTKGIGRIDRVISKLKTRITETDSSIEDVQDQAATVQGKLQDRRFSNIVKFQYSLKRKLRLISEINIIKNKNNRIIVLIQTLADIQDNIKITEKQVVPDNLLGGISKDYDSLLNLTTDTAELEDLLVKYGAYVKEESGVGVLSETAYDFLAGMMEYIIQTTELTDRINKFSAIIKEEFAVMKEITVVDSELKTIFDKLDICPLCNTVLRRAK